MTLPWRGLVTEYVSLSFKSSVVSAGRLLLVEKHLDGSWVLVFNNEGVEEGNEAAEKIREVVRDMGWGKHRIANMAACIIVEGLKTLNELNSTTIKI